eukprot:6961372-Prymnesium_polylepis.1
MCTIKRSCTHPTGRTPTRMEERAIASSFLPTHHPPAGRSTRLDPGTTDLGKGLGCVFSLRLRSL